MHGAETAGHRAPQPLRVAGPLQGRPCSRRQISGSKPATCWMRTNLSIFLTSRLRAHSSQTVESPAPRTEPLGGSGPVPLRALTTASRDAQIWLDSGGQPGIVLSLIHISEPTRLGMISYAVFCL